MDTTIVQGLFAFMTENIFSIIYLFAVVEVYLVVQIFFMLKQHQNVLLDVTDNLMKGFEDAPDKDSSQHGHEKIQAALQFMTDKISLSPASREKFFSNASKAQERPIYNRHYRIEIFASVMSTLVQIFPLLGILGTILAIAQTAFQSGDTASVQGLSSAFVLAMDTTILGISFSILFMIVESTFWPKIERVIFESSEYQKLISSIYLGSAENP